MYRFIRSGWEIKSDKPVDIPPGHRVALSISSHEFCPLSNYICTLPSSSFETIESSPTNKIQSIMSLKVEKVKLATTKSFILSTATTCTSNTGFYSSNKKCSS